MNMGKELRPWTKAEILLDQLLHNEKLALDDEWMKKVAETLQGCPKTWPEGTRWEIQYEPSVDL